MSREMCVGRDSSGRNCRNKPVTVVPAAGSEAERSAYVYPGPRCRKCADAAMQTILLLHHRQLRWAQEWDRSQL